VDDGEAVGGAGQRDVQVVPADRGLGQDPGRVDQHHPVELQALGLAHGEQRDRRVEHLGPVAGHRRGQCPGQLGNPRGGRDHGETARVGHLDELFLYYAGDEGEAADGARRDALLADGLGRLLVGGD
jgi:hypothetical protein